MSYKSYLKYFILNILLFITIIGYSQKSLYGKWESTEKGDVGFFNFDEKGYAVLSVNNESLGGENYMYNGITANLTYTVDYTTNPINIDLILTNIESNTELGRVLGIIEFIGNKKIKIRLDFEGIGRPLNFLPLDNEDTAILTKVE